jgi:ABC-type amino acid transport substrate-binding protein
MTLDRANEGISLHASHAQLRDAVQWALNSMMNDGTYLSILTTYGLASCAYTP